MKKIKKRKTILICIMIGILTFSLLSPFLMGCGKKKDVVDVGEPTEVSLDAMEGYLAEPTEVANPGELAVDPSAAGHSTSLGQMTYYPNGDGALAALAGSNLFTLYFENPGVALNQGFITFYDAKTATVYESVDVSSYGRCKVSPIDDAGMLLTGWDHGTKVDISLSSPFLAGGSYYVLMDGGCFTDGTFLSKEQLNASFIKFSVKDYGVDQMTGFARTYAQGARAILMVLLGGDAVRAQVAGYDGEYLSFSSSSFDMDSELTVTFLKEGAPSFRIEFYDAQGTMIDSMTFSVDVVGSSATMNISY